MNEDEGMGEVRFPATIGLGYRKQFKQVLKKFCWEHNYPLEITEDKGFFETVMYVRIEVPNGEAKALKEVLEDWFVYLNEI
jgi:hypothetical protein